MRKPPRILTTTANGHGCYTERDDESGKKWTGTKANNGPDQTSGNRQDILGPLLIYISVIRLP